MSVTHSVGMKAAVFLDSGTCERFYALFEQTYDSNTYPKSPAWGLYWFGNAASCIDQILIWSKLCEAGMHQGRNTRWTARQYIAKWREALEAPAASQQSRLEGTFVVDGYGRDIVNFSRRDGLLPVIASHGEHVDGNRFRIYLDKPGALQALAQSCAPSDIARLFHFHEVSDYADEKLGVPVPRAAKVSLDGVEVFHIADPESQRFERNHVLMLDGVGRPSGWRYATMGAFIDAVVRERERTHPGSAGPLLAAFEAMLADAPALPDDFALRLDPALDKEACPYRLRTTMEVVARFGDQASCPLFTTVGAARAVGELMRLTCGGLPCEVRSTAATHTHSPEGMASHAGQELEAVN